MNNQTQIILILLVPIFIGAIIAIINHNKINDITERIELWFRNSLANTKTKKGKFNKFIIYPIVWLIVKFSDWTDGFSHRGLKNGVRTSAILYLTISWFLLIIYSFAFLLMLAFSIAVIYFILKIIFNSDNSTSKTLVTETNTYNSQKQQNTFETIGTHGKKIYSGSNWFNEELKGRVDEEGNIYSGTNFFNEEKIGRISDDGTIFKGSNYFNEEKVGRINKDGSLHKGSNWFNEEKTGRIDNNGNIHKGTSWLNEEKTGRLGD